MGLGFRVIAYQIYKARAFEGSESSSKGQVVKECENSKQKVKPVIDSGGQEGDHMEGGCLKVLSRMTGDVDRLLGFWEIAATESCSSNALHCQCKAENKSTEARKSRLWQRASQANCRKSRAVCHIEESQYNQDCIAIGSLTYGWLKSESQFKRDAPLHLAISLLYLATSSTTESYLEPLGQDIALDLAIPALESYEVLDLHEHLVREETQM
ncbi:hypothetical protein OBBRIDRAFT_865056 [Obba rivulosa]|uniref:Uncharacterized protein n=1 Tax=Obba rivulosa TaxID=1052685 RepID=A0A8E2DG14_9APHY|nr:hypothetical protein OBBRIDRAFT_865056 [Obba rivulosa]